MFPGFIVLFAARVDTIVSEFREPICMTGGKGKDIKKTFKMMCNMLTFLFTSCRFSMGNELQVEKSKSDVMAKFWCKIPMSGFVGKDVPKFWDVECRISAFVTPDQLSSLAPHSLHVILDEG